MPTLAQSGYRSYSRVSGAWRACAWCLVIGSCALLAGFVGGLETRIPAVLVIAIIAATAIMTMSVNAVLWLLLVVTLVLTGLIQYFGRINQIQWLPSLLAFMMFMRALLETFGNKRVPKALQATRRADMPVLVWCFVVFVFLALVANIGKWQTALQFMAGVKNYIAIWGVLILFVVARLSPEKLARLWQGVIAVAFLQFPVVVFQHFFVASKRASSNAGYHRAAWDSVVGTFGGDPDGGGASGALVLYLVIALALVLALWKNGLLRLPALILSSAVMLVAIALGEVKLVLVLLPLAVTLLFRGELFRRPVMLLGGLLLVTLSLVAVTMAYQALYWDGSGGARLEPVEHVQRAFAKAVDPGNLDRSTGEVGRAATLALWVNDSRAGIGERALGHGFGASRISFVGVGEVAKRYYPYRIGYTAAASMLWDIGALGLLAFTAVLCAGGVAALRLSRSSEIPPFHRAVLDTSVVAIALYYVSVCYNADVLYLPATGFMLMLFLGQVVYWYRRVERNPGHHVAWACALPAR